MSKEDPVFYTNPHGVVEYILDEDCKYVGDKYVFFIDGEITESITDYYDLLHSLRMAQEEDEIMLYINSEGGTILTALALVDGIRRTKATTISYVPSFAGSCAVNIALSTDKIIMSEGSSLWMHNARYAYGYHTKKELDGRIKADLHTVKTLFYKTLNKVLTDSEIDSIIENNECIALLDFEVEQRLSGIGVQ